MCVQKVYFYTCLSNNSNASHLDLFCVYPNIPCLSHTALYCSIILDTIKLLSLVIQESLGKVMLDFILSLSV